MSFIAGHLLCNGMDIVDELADSVLEFYDKKFEKFGMDLGQSLRKVFLSSAAEPPEGPPERKVLEDMVTGLIDGLFGPGTKLELIGKNGEERDIDLHKCVTENEGIPLGAWEIAWKFF